MKPAVENFSLYLVHETADARLYRNVAGAEMWIPRSVCPDVVKSAKDPRRHAVEVEKWWLKKHPWPKTAERQLL